jgi:hypothetical protein
MDLAMRRSKPLSPWSGIGLALYLLALVGLGSHLLWPQKKEPPLRVTSVQLAPEGDSILLEGEGFSAATQVSLALDVGNRRFLRHTVPTWGRGADLVRVGGFLYLADLRKGLVILELTEPQRPRIVGTLALPGRARTLIVEAGVAYVACDGAGLALVDVGDPASPRLLATLPGVPGAQGLAVRGGRLYAAVYSSKVDPALAVVEVANPRQPQLLGRLPLPGQPIGLRFWGERLLVAVGEAGLVGLELPPRQALPRIHSRLALPGPAFALEVVGTQVYVACGWKGLSIVALTEAGAQLQTQLPLPGHLTRLVAEAGRLYLGAGAAGGLVVDIALPDQPRLLGAFTTSEGRPGLAAFDRTLYLTAAGQGIEVLDLGEPTPLQSAEPQPLAEGIAALALTPDLLVATTFAGNLQLLDRRKPGLPAVATLPLQGLSRFVEIQAGMVYISIPGRGIEAVDLRKPQGPVHLGLQAWAKESGRLTGERNTIALAGKRVAAVDDGARLWVFDVDASGRSQPRPGPALAEGVGMVRWGQDLLLVSSLRRGEIFAIDVDPPEPPRVYPALALPAKQIKDFAVMGEVVVLSCGLEGLFTVDFSNPGAPRLLGALNLPLRADQLQLQGDSAYVLDRTGTLLQIDLSDPARPRLQSRLDPGLNIQAFAVAGSRAYLATGGRSLLVVPLPQTLQPLSLEAERMSLALPPIDTPGHYTLRLSDGRQTLELPGALQLPR